MSPPLHQLVEEFCIYQRKPRGKTEGGVRAYRWTLEQFLRFMRTLTGRPPVVDDLTATHLSAWMIEMAKADLALSTMRVRQSVVSSFCIWLVKRGLLASNPVEALDRPKVVRTPPAGVPEAELMDALVRAVIKRGRPRDIAMFLILRYTGGRRESVATLAVKNLDGDWGLRGVRVKGGTTRDIPVPEPVMRYLHAYVRDVLPGVVTTVTSDTPLFWAKWGRPSATNATPNARRNLLAGGGGFEPPLRGPEPRVLPLDDPPPTHPTLPHPPMDDRLA